MQRSAIILFLITFLSFASTVMAREMLTGKVVTSHSTSPVSVVDGDGLRVGDVRIRLWGIDAPELKQSCATTNDVEYACGEDARFLLDALLMAGELKCIVKEKDRYNRLVAICDIEGRDLAAEMVRQGQALDWVKYSKGFYKAQEDEARQNRRGLWAGKFIKPWEWRKAKPR